MTGVGNDPNDRSTLAKVMTGTALFGGILKGAVVDRPRIVAAYPHAKETGKLGEWAFQLVSGNATTDVVPRTGPIKLGPKVWNNGFRRAYQVSNALTIALVGVNMVYGIPNLVDGWKQGDGFDGLLESRAGRTGLMAAFGGLVELGIFSYAFARSPSGSGRLAAMLEHGIHGKGAVMYGKILLTAPILANELGFLDFMNRGDDRSPWQTARDTYDSKVESAKDFLPGGD